MTLEPGFYWVKTSDGWTVCERNHSGRWRWIDSDSSCSEMYMENEFTIGPRIEPPEEK